MTTPRTHSEHLDYVAAEPIDDKQQCLMQKLKLQPNIGRFSTNSLWHRHHGVNIKGVYNAIKCWNKQWVCDIYFRMNDYLRKETLDVVMAKFLLYIAQTHTLIVWEANK